MGEKEKNRNQKMGARNSVVDIVKGVAIIFVVLVHSRQRIHNFSSGFDFLMYGQMGCQMFFVVSGYLAAVSLSKNSDKILFWKKRFSRIAPGLYLMLIITHIMNAILKHVDLSIGFANNTNPLAILINVLFLNGVIPFGNNDVMAGGWYIGTTAVLYFMAPWLDELIKKVKNKQIVPIFFLAVAVIIAAVIDITVGRDKITNNSFFYYNFVVQLPCFLLGMMLTGKENGDGTSDLVATFGFTGVSIVLFFANLPDYKYILCVTMVGYATYYLIRLLTAVNAHNCLLEALGRRSYFIYLCHPFFVWTMPAFVQKIISVQNAGVFYICLLPVMFVGSYVVAMILERICKPILDRLRQCIMD